jgi:DNA-binding transcriptional LysR family regulator
MDTYHIKEFAVLAECPSFSEAADRLYISQSSLSKHIRALERELGTPLFKRTTRSIQLTDAGELFLNYAKEISRLCDEVSLAVDDYKRKTSVSLTIATLHNPQYYDLAKYILSFQQSHPDIKFQILESDEFGLYDMFQKRQVNIFPTFAAYATFHNTIEYDFIPMVSSRIMMICRKDHPLAGEESISLGQLANEKLLLPTRDSTLNHLIMVALRAYDVTPEIVYEGSSLGCVDLVKAGIGVTLHAVEFADFLRDDSDLSILEITPTIPFIYGVGHRDEKQLTHAEKLFLQHLSSFELK